MKSLLYYVSLPLLFYPGYFMVANTFDSLFGDQLLINWLYFDSHSVLLKTFIADWLSSLPVMYAVFYLLIMPLVQLSEKYFKGSTLPVYIGVCIIVITGSGLIGFSGMGLIVNSSTVIFLIVLYYISRDLLLSESKK